MKKIIPQTGRKIAYFAGSNIFGLKKKRQQDAVANELESKKITEVVVEVVPEVVLPEVTPPKEIEKTEADKRAAKKSTAREKKSGHNESPEPQRKLPWTLDQFQVVPREGLSRFHDFDLPLSVMHGIADQNFEYCTPIQAKSLPTVLEGKDLVGKANTGTGKSAVFLIAVIARLLADSEQKLKNGSPRALVMAPTRELVIQIAKDAKQLAEHTGLRVHAVYGGAQYQAQMAELRDKVVDIVIATPGRLIDFANKNVISFKKCGIMVIDEADRMLDMGFIPDMRRIISRIPPREERQTLLFSATLSDDVRKLAYQWCVKPEYVEAEQDQVSVDAIDQRVYLVTTEEKYFVLYNLIKSCPEHRIMVFANMKSEVRKLSEKLQRDGIECALLSGDVAQDKRESRLERFRDGKVKVLVATDVAGRGIHIEGISYVVNFTLPYEPEDYVHRIGRTGRAGAEGVSVSFACEEGAFVLPEIEEYIDRSLECVVPPEELVVPPPESPNVSAKKKRPHRPRPNRGRRPRPTGKKGEGNQS